MLLWFQFEMLNKLNSNLGWIPFPVSIYMYEKMYFKQRFQNLSEKCNCRTSWNICHVTLKLLKVLSKMFILWNKSYIFENRFLLCLCYKIDDMLHVMFRIFLLSTNSWRILVSTMHVLFFHWLQAHVAIVQCKWIQHCNPDSFNFYRIKQMHA